MSRRFGFSCIAARAVMADTTRRVSSRSSGRSITCPNVVRNTLISPYLVASVRTSSDVSDTRATPALLISFPPTTRVWGVKFNIFFIKITTCTAWIWFFPYMFFCLFSALVHYQGGGIPCSVHIRHVSGFILLHIRTVDTKKAHTGTKKRNAFAIPRNSYPNHNLPYAGGLVCADCRVGLLYAVWRGSAAWVNELFGTPVHAYTDTLSLYAARISLSNEAARFFRRRCFFRESCCMVRRFLLFSF